MKRMKRVALIVLDGVGCGAQPDANKYGDTGADTLGHVWTQEKPDIPNLTELGLLSAAGISTPDEDEPIGCFGRMTERAAGKDTTTGHWEIAGLTLEKPFPTYPNGFPPELIKAFEDEIGMGTIGNRPASGTQIIEELGAEHLRTGKLIVYTSADSVFQIAAHEGIIPPTELWHICRIARRMLKGEHAVGRVIARPFVGEVGHFVRTENRRDFSVDPTGTTMLDALKGEGYDVLGVGKIPMVLEDDRMAIQVALRTLTNVDKDRARVVYIKNTLSLQNVLISEALLEQARSLDGVEILEGPRPMRFDENGTLLDFA